MSTLIIFIVLCAFIIGYLISWFIHGSLYARIGHFIDFLNDGNYTVRRAWRLSGRVI